MTQNAGVGVARAYEGRLAPDDAVRLRRPSDQMRPERLVHEAKLEDVAGGHGDGGIHMRPVADGAATRPKAAKKRQRGVVAALRRQRHENLGAR